MKKFIGLSLILVLSLGILTGCGAKEDENQAGRKIRVGVVGSESEVWDYIAKEVKKDGIDLEVVFFGDYNQPNRALADGDIDLNSFQHYAFFNKYIDEHSLDLSAIGETVIAPLGIYSEKISSLDELKEGDKLAIPNDISNGGRALVLLETAGLISLDRSAEELPTVKNIVDNRLNLEILEMDAATIPNIIDDVDIAVINSGIASDSGRVPAEDSIFLEPVDDNSKQYINIIVSRTDEKDDEDYKKIVETYQTKEVEEILDRLNKGSQVTVW